MTTTEKIEENFKSTVCREVELVPEGTNRYQVLTPFRYDDGDYFSVVLKEVDGNWILTDEGQTFMHLSYRMDLAGLDKGNRANIISTTLANFNITENHGVLTAPVSAENSGNVFYDFLQGLTKISDVSYLSREIVRSTFWEDFKALINQSVPASRVEFNYRDKKHDPDGNYPVDCRLNGMERPLFIFAINNDAKCKDVTINLHQYENWDLRFDSLAVFEHQEEISRRVLARFSDVSGKQFSSLYSNKDRIQRFLGEITK